MEMDSFAHESEMNPAGWTPANENMLMKVLPLRDESLSLPK